MKKRILSLSIMICLLALLFPCSTIFASEDSLTRKLKEYTSDSIVRTYYNDFNNDGKFEMFAFTGQKSYDEYWGTDLLIGDIWFVSDDYVRHMTNNSGTYWGIAISGNVCPEYYYDGDLIFLKYETIASQTQLFSSVLCVDRNGTAKRNNFNGYLYKYGDNYLVNAKSYDMTIGKTDLTQYGADSFGIGATWKDYWYYFDSTSFTFREYGGIEISTEDFKKYNGADAILSQIDGNIYNIIFRANNIININIVKDSYDVSTYDTYNILIEYDSSNVWIIKNDYDEIESSGLYLNALNPDNAVYPQFDGVTGSDSGISVILNGNELSFDQSPIMKNDRVMVPIRAIFEAMGATVEWDQATQTVTSKKGTTTIQLSIGSNILYKDDAPIYLDVPAQIINERTMIPVRAIAEALGANVSWNGETHTVYIEYIEIKEKDSVIQSVCGYGFDYKSAENVLMNLYSDYNADTKDSIQKAINAYVRTNGFETEKELRAFNSYAANAQRGYNYLMNDEAFVADMFETWLYSSAKGTAARSMLYTSGLIFNNEATAYINPATYFNFQTPGVKKYKAMLLEFMNNKNAEVEIVEYTNLAYDIVKNATDTTDKIITDKALNELNACNTKVEVNTWLNKTMAVYYPNKKGYNILMSEKTKLGKALGYAGTTINVVSNSIDDIVTIINLGQTIETLQNYSDFLYDIAYNGDQLPNELRYAAADLYEDIDAGYLIPIKEIASHIVSYASDDMLDISGTLQTSVLDKAGDKILSLFNLDGGATLGEAMMVIKISALVTNKIIDMKDLVNDAAYVEGYVYLSRFYKQQVEDSLNKFMTNQTTNNANDFIRKYNLLFALRKAGEEAYLDLYDVEGIAGKLMSFGYDMKKNATDTVIDYLNNECQFKMYAY